MSRDILIFISLAYAGFLFFIAYYADRVARRNQNPPWLRSPITYTLSLSVYCTAWTFYGAVGSAARSGLEFLAIYIGPSLMFFGFWLILRRMVRIGHQQNITSVADFLSSRYGKSKSLAVIVTIILVIATTPYISLQLQSIAQSFALFVPDLNQTASINVIAAFAALALTIFAILFGTRNARVNERHDGVVVAIAVESIVKLIAIIIVGAVLVKSFGGIKNVFETPIANDLIDRPLFTTRWFSLVSLSFMAVIVLPRMFHVIVVENENERNLFTASWAFPLYLLVLNLFVLPVAIIGLNVLGPSANPDYFLITVPLQLDKPWVAYLAFIGGLSAATSMIIISAIALANMISNHIALPLWLDARGSKETGDDVKNATLYIRRVAIGVIMLLGYAYFEIAGARTSLASIGLIAFVGVSQLFPSLMAALFWRGANRNGALLGIVLGASVWIYTLFIPSFEGLILSAQTIEEGPLGIKWLSPHALLGSQIDDHVVHALFWSMLLNVTGLFLGSILSTPRALERLQANQFVDVFNPLRSRASLKRQSDIRLEDYIVLAQRVLGKREANTVIRNIAEAQGRMGEYPIVNDFFVDRLESAMGGVLGGATTHTLISQLAGAGSLPVSETIKLADETVQNMEYAKALEIQSFELETTAQALREANASLVALDAQKDAFLSQVSHELRTPMSAIRSFTEILLEEDEITPEERQKMLTVIAKENHRLTDLLDELLDMSYLESGKVRMANEPHDVVEILERSLHVTQPIWQEAGLEVQHSWASKSRITLCDFNRVSQIFINLITNAAKYVRSSDPQLTIKILESDGYWQIEFIDNGPGIATEDRDSIFEKFARGGASEIAGSAGLGLAISREIAQNLGGQLELMPSVKGSRFRVSLLKA